MSDDSSGKSEFEKAQSEKGIVAEFWEFLKENRKFWMIPILLVLLVIGGLLIAGGSGAGVFIYTLF